MKRKNSNFNPLINKLLIVKLFWNRAMGHIALPLNIFEKISLLYLVLDKVGYASIWTIGSAFVLLTGGTLLFGYLDVKYKIYDMETSLNNQYNPEIKTMLKNSKKQKLYK